MVVEESHITRHTRHTPRVGGAHQAKRVVRVAAVVQMKMLYTG
jgi:hypothetical protein